jgi:hypothetical protein
MRPLRLSACVLMLLYATSATAAGPPDSLERARMLYNQRNFDGALEAAENARRVPARTGSADLIAARAYLEKFRETALPDDLARARERLRGIDAERLSPDERAELVVGLGEELFFEDAAGAAADLFDSLLVVSPGPNPPGPLTPVARERVLDWWASALDAQARPRSSADRDAIYQRVRDRMRAELGANPASTSASYWLAAAALGQGDAQGAWDAALAGWVRAPIADDRGAALRGDLDGLVQRGIVPARSKMLAQPPETVRAEWNAFKAQWNR